MDVSDRRKALPLAASFDSPDSDSVAPSVQESEKILQQATAPHPSHSQTTHPFLLALAARWHPRRWNPFWIRAWGLI
jgi:hypothetical protein